MSHVDNIYKGMINLVLECGDYVPNRTGIPTYSIFGHQERFDLRVGFPLLTTKKVHVRSIFTELIWFLLGRSDNQWLNDRGVTIWDEWATVEQCARFGRQAGDLGPIYGHQWRRFGSWDYDKKPSSSPVGNLMQGLASGVDQIAKQLETFRNKPHDRRNITTGWNPLEADSVALPPCHTLWQTKLYYRNGKDDTEGYWLDLQLYQRSCDLGLGVPFNIASYAALAHILAHLSTVDIKPRYFIHTYGDLHIYENHVDQLKMQMDREPFAMPSFGISPGWAGEEMAALDPDSHIQPEDLVVMDYECHPVIKMDVAV